MPVLPSSGNYLLQPNIEQMHRTTLDWLSATMLWKNELAFFQKLIETYRPKFPSESEKIKLEDFQKFFRNDSSSKVENFQVQLRNHESKLSSMYQERKDDNSYYEEHKTFINEISVFGSHYNHIKNDFLDFIQKVM